KKVYNQVSDEHIGVFARRYDHAGTAKGPEFRVSPLTTDNEYLRPAVASGTNGAFVVVWSNFENDFASVWARRYDATGSSLGPRFQVNSATSEAYSNAQD